jgi:uroporphyrinogen-III synthase
VPEVPTALPRPRVWVSRTLPAAGESARHLTEFGYDAFAAPLLRVVFAPTTPDLAAVGALIFTSRNGVAAFAARTPERRFTVFTVGDATAAAARRAGFDEVVSAAGDVDALRALLLARGRREGGRLLRVGAREPAGDLVSDLSAAGFEVAEWACYHTVEVPGPQVIADLEAAGRPADAILVYSPKAARALAHLPDIARSRLRAAVCISAAAAAPLEVATPCALHIARHPDEASMFAALRAALPPQAASQP